MQPSKVLLVDDSMLMHKLFSALLPKATLVSAHDGIEALERLAEHPDIDLMLLDINMPRMNGLELLRRVKAEPPLAGIPVVIVTTEGKEEDTINGLRAGAAAYLRKPFQRREILDLIERL